MNQQAFDDFVVRSSRRVLGATIGHLVLTQTRTRGTAEVPKIREPEMRHGLAQEAESSRIHYGIEVPTLHTYRFTDTPGEGRVSARHDFAVLDGPHHDADRRILIELKEGQPAVSKISKDIEKLLREPATSGKSMIHIVQGNDSGTFPSLLKKYQHAIEEGYEGATEAGFERGEDPSWFSLYVLVADEKSLWHWSTARINDLAAVGPLKQLAQCA